MTVTTSFYWPFLVAGMAFSWELSDAQAAKLREYLRRGGFLFCDSFFGENELVATTKRA